MTNDERFDRIDAALERMGQRFDGINENYENSDQTTDSTPGMEGPRRPS